MQIFIVIKNLVECVRGIMSVSVKKYWTNVVLIDKKLDDRNCKVHHVLDNPCTVDSTAFY